MSELPEGWVLSSINDGIKKMTGGASPRSEDYTPAGCLVLNKGDIKEFGKVSLKKNPNRIPEDFASKHMDKIVKHGDILLTLRDLSSKADFLGLIGRYDGVEKALITQGMFILKVDDNLIDQYLVHYSNAPSYRNVVKEKKVGATQVHLRNEQFLNIKIPLAPLPEQKRIVDKLDTLLARIDATRERLDRIPATLNQFRQAVLAAATSGALTEGWREGKIISQDWQKVRLYDVGEFGRGKSKHRPRNDPKLYDGAYPFIQTGNIANSGGLIKSHSQTYSEFGLAQSKLWPEGTLCITIAANIADTAILSYPACFPDSVVGFAPDKSKCTVQFIKWTIDVIKNDLESYAPATAQKNINLGILSEIQFDVPSLDEQNEIVRRVEKLFALADNIEARYQTARAQVDKLTPALLAKAFRGELVEQDPNDEPAEKLLERVRAAMVERPAHKERTVKNVRKVKIKG